ncbi:SPRY domain protein [Opisthorchis viverrini]|uniref:SPRY domain protein n=1 Tax=Opisthorchis viverrini TaxID=6198 RepID=A0A1S8X9X7_OPIVI|nr:SPRY domain protein [Opisthorchis viverrini]
MNDKSTYSTFTSFPPANRSSNSENAAPIVLRADNAIPVCCSVYYFEVSVNVKNRSGKIENVEIHLRWSVGSNWVLESDGFDQFEEQKTKTINIRLTMEKTRLQLAFVPLDPLLLNGLSFNNTGQPDLSRFLITDGMEASSCGYHSNNGSIFHAGKELPTSGPTFGETDVIGCGVNFVTNSVFFTKNGVFMGPISIGRKLPYPVYPCVAIACSKCHVSANFGQQKFSFDIGQYIARERAVVISAAVDRKCNDQLAHVTMRKLVAAYLLHNGYLDSASALGGWVSQTTIPEPPRRPSDLFLTNGDRKSTPVTGKPTEQKPADVSPLSPASSIQTPALESSRSLSSPVTTPFQFNCSTPNTKEEDLLQWPEPTELLLRRRHLRDTIRRGDYLSALEQLETHFKALMEQDPSIGFVLRCHHFINLMCNQADSSCASGKNPDSASVPTQQSYSPVHRHNSQPALNITDASSRIGAQKRPKPSSSLESSPEPIVNGFNGCEQQPSRQSRLLPTPRVVQSQHHQHEHSPSSCQAPIRLRLDAPAHLERRASLNDTTPLPVYPLHHQCYPDEPLRNCSVTTPPTTVDRRRHSTHVINRVVPGSHRISEGHKHTTRVLGGVCLPVCGPPELERGLDSIGAAVGLLDLTGTEQRLGNGRPKCINIIRRGKSRDSSVVSPSADPPAPTNESENGTRHPVGNSYHCSREPSMSNGTNIRVSTFTNGAVSTPSPTEPSPAFSHSATPNKSQELNSEIEDQKDKPDSNKTNGSSNDNSSCLVLSSCWSTKDVIYLVEYGRMLRATALELQCRNAITDSQLQLLSVSLLSDVVSKYQLFTSIPVGVWMRSIKGNANTSRSKTNVEQLQVAKYSIHLNQPACPVLDTALAFLETSLMGSDGGASGQTGDSGIGVSGSEGTRTSLQPVDRLSSPRHPQRTPIGNNSFPARRSSDPSDVLNQQRTSTVAYTANFRRTSPVRTLVISRTTRQNPSSADSQSLGTADTAEDPSVRITRLTGDTHSSVISTSIYIPPSALVSLGSRSQPQLNNRASAITTSPSTTSSGLLRPTSLTGSANPHSRGPPSSLFPSTTASPQSASLITTTSNTHATWSSTRTQSRHTASSAASRSTVAVSCVLEAQAPTGSELAGFFHPLLFID